MCCITYYYVLYAFQSFSCLVMLPFRSTLAVFFSVCFQILVASMVTSRTSPSIFVVLSSDERINLVLVRNLTCVFVRNKENSSSNIFLVWNWKYWTFFLMQIPPEIFSNIEERPGLVGNMQVFFPILHKGRVICFFGR